MLATYEHSVSQLVSNFIAVIASKASKASKASGPSGPNGPNVSGNFSPGFIADLAVKPRVDSQPLLACMEQVGHRNGADLKMESLEISGNSVEIHGNASSDFSSTVCCRTHFHLQIL